MILTTARLRLVPIVNFEYVQDIYDINQDLEVMKYITGRALSLDETIDYIELARRNWNEYSFSAWAILDIDTNEFIGTSGVGHIEFNPANPVEVGWRLKHSKWNRGYATEAAVAMTDFTFNSTDVEHLYGLCCVENKKSERVMQRLGMRYQGIQRWYGLDLSSYRLTRRSWLSCATFEPEMATTA